MRRIEKYFLTVKSSKLVLLVFVWLLGSHTNLVAQENKSSYSYLADVLDSYCTSFLSGPESLKELIEFVDIYQTSYPEESHIYNAFKILTIPKLIENEGEIKIIRADCEYAMLLNDTILYSYSDFPCCDFVEDYYLEEQFLIIRKKIEKGIYLFRNKVPLLEKKQFVDSLMKKMKKLYERYPISKDKIIFLKFVSGGNLSDYCKIGINIDEDYYKEIKKVLDKFCKKYKITELFLYAYRI